MYENYAYRRKQLEISFDVLNLCQNSFLMGDFNYDPILNYEEENSIDKNKYIDSWIEYNQNFNLIDSGFTFPQEENIPPTRLDRIYFSRQNIFSLKEIKIIGDNPIEVEYNKYSNYDVNTASDHKGLYAEFFIK